jgi:hypothetical protein
LLNHVETLQTGQHAPSGVSNPAPSYIMLRIMRTNKAGLPSASPLLFA